MRYEAFHSQFKKIALKSNNYKNLLKMLATRYRLKQIHSSSSMIHLKNFDEAIKLQKVDKNCFNNLMKETLIKHFGNVDFAKDLHQCSKFYHKNVEYHRSGVYIIDLVDTNKTPRFVQIVRILRMNIKWWLLVDMLQTICYDEKLYAWEIRSVDSFSVLDPYCLKYYYKGLDVYELNNSSFISFTARLTTCW